MVQDILRNKWWVEPGLMASQTARFYGYVSYNIKMTTLHDRITIQINGRTYRTEKHTHNIYQKVQGFNLSIYL